MFGRFENHGIASEQSWHNMPIGQVAGEVIRPKHRHHAQRPMAQYQLITRRFTHGFTGTLMISTNRNCDFSGDRRRFRARFPQRLARLPATHSPAIQCVMAIPYCAKIRK
ncbi:Uncharacterised protein [Vibrio cholerae]|nr:Uncharacterised protein [Vibrio cholerae]